MISALLSGISTAAMSAGLGTALPWTDLYTTSFNSAVGLTSNRTYMMVYNPGMPLSAFTKIRLTFQSRVSNTMTVSKVYVGEVTATRGGFLFQNAPTEVKFGGASGFSLAASSSIQSDETNLAFTGAFALGVCLVLTANSGLSLTRLIDSTWFTTLATGDVTPDPAMSGFTYYTFAGMLLLADIDVVNSSWLAASRIRASRQSVYAVKEGSLPVVNGIKAVNQSFYVVKG